MRWLFALLGSALLALPALAQEEAPEVTMETREMKSAQATKHVALIEVGLETAELNSEMLRDLSKDEKTWDQMHSEALTQNIADGLADAEEHLKHLEPLAGNSQRFMELQQRIDSANRLLPQLQKASDARSVHEETRRMEQALDRTERPLQQVARDLDVRLDVG